LGQDADSRRFLISRFRKNQRIEALVREYGPLDQDFLVECTEAYTQAVLGTERAKNAIIAIREGRMDEFIRQGVGVL